MICVVSSLVCDGRGNVPIGKLSSLSTSSMAKRAATNQSCMISTHNQTHYILLHQALAATAYPYLVGPDSPTKPSDTDGSPNECFRWKANLT